MAQDLLGALAPWQIILIQVNLSQTTSQYGRYMFSL
jgi:hypothetical protein